MVKCKFCDNEIVVSHRTSFCDKECKRRYYVIWDKGYMIGRKWKLNNSKPLNNI